MLTMFRLARDEESEGESPDERGAGSSPYVCPPFGANELVNPQSHPPRTAESHARLEEDQEQQLSEVL